MTEPILKARPVKRYGQVTAWTADFELMREILA
jgi:hypothetical protein